MTEKSSRLFLFVLALSAVVACGPKSESAETADEPAPPVEEVAAATDEGPTAVAHLQARADTKIEGTVTFRQAADHVKIIAEVTGIGAGMHGFHIHETGDCSAADFTSAGGHFNPADVPHGAPDDLERHAGDLGNIELTENGTGRLESTSELLTVDAGPSSVVGRAVVLHENADDLVSQPTGAAGGRIACGVIMLEGDAPGAY